MPTYFNLDTSPQFLNANPDYQQRVANGGPGTIYYDDARTVSSVSNDGNIAAGASTLFRTPVWLASGSSARVVVEEVPNTLGVVVTGGVGSGRPSKHGATLWIQPEDPSAAQDYDPMIDTDA